MPNRMVLSQKTRIFLKSRGFNLAEVARKAEMKPDDLYGMLSGRRVMTADDFIDICKASGATPDDIAGIELPQQSA